MKNRSESIMSMEDARIQIFFVRACPTFFVDERREDPNSTISGLLAKPKTLNAGLVALWFSQGIRTSIAKIPIFLSFFSGGPVAPSASAHDEVPFFKHIKYFILLFYHISC